MQKLKERHIWGWMNFLLQRRKVNQQWINPCLQFRNYKIMWILWATPGSSVIVKRRAIMGHPTSPVFGEFSESSRIDWPRFLFPDRDTEYIWYVGKVFEGSFVSERISRISEIVKYSISCFTSRHGHRRETRPNPFGEHHKRLVHTFGGKTTENQVEIKFSAISHSEREKFFLKIRIRDFFDWRAGQIARGKEVSWKSIFYEIVRWGKRINLSDAWSELDVQECKK